MWRGGTFHVTSPCSLLQLPFPTVSCIKFLFPYVVLCCGTTFYSVKQAVPILHFELTPHNWLAHCNGGPLHVRLSSLVQIRLAEMPDLRAAVVGHYYIYSNRCIDLRARLTNNLPSTEI